MSDQVLVIRMQHHETTCYVCGKRTDGGFGVPTFNGDLVSNAFPDWLDWGGQPACEDRRHERGELVTYDHYYRHLFGGFEGGAGI